MGLSPYMSRTKGAKDKKPRALSENSLANIPAGVPGCAGMNVWVYGESEDIRWFGQLSSRERGAAIRRARKMTGMDEPDLSE